MGFTKNRTRCEIYSRVCGYLRPIDCWNAGKQSEFKDRQCFDTSKVVDVYDCDPSGEGCKSCQRYLDDCDGKEDEIQD